MVLEGVPGPLLPPGPGTAFPGARRSAIWDATRPRLDSRTRSWPPSRPSPTSPSSPIAPIAGIEPWQDSGKDVINLAEPAGEIAPIPLVPRGRVKALQNLRYTTRGRIAGARVLDDVF